MTSSAPRRSSRFNRDGLLEGLLILAAALSAVILGLVALFLILESIPAGRRIGWQRFFTDPSWHPSAGLYDLTPMIVGSILVTLGSLVLAAPIGLAGGITAQLYLPERWARWYRRAMALLAGVPSVVLGLFGLLTIVPAIARFEPPGASWLAGSCVLAVMILPTIVLSTDAALGAVPRELLTGAAALGLGRWTTTRRVAWPAARAAISTGIALAVARAIGETMVVLMVCGNVVQVPGSLFDPVRTLTANIALEMAYATSTHRAALFFGGLLLVVGVGVTLLLVLIGRWHSRRASDA